MPVGHRTKHPLLYKLAPEKRALGTAAGTKASSLATQREQLLGPAFRASEASESSQEGTTGKVLPDDFIDDTSPPAVMLLEALLVGGLELVEVMIEEC